jgi:signal transduction histidine kinase
MTLIAIQAEAAALALRASPERAAEPIEAIRATAHRTLDEMRAVLDVLAPSGDGQHPVSEGLDVLVERARAAGIDNSLAVKGNPHPDHAPVSLAVSRIVRECLTNAGRHAPGQPVSLMVEWGPEEVLVRATNPGGNGHAPVPGRGLTGIRHRAELLGGRFETVTDQGLFDVRVHIPAGEPT